MYRNIKFSLHVKKVGSVNQKD